MTALSPLIHFALTLADGLDAACDEMPEPACTDARITLSGFARGLQIAAEKLKGEEAERERRMMERVE